MKRKLKSLLLVLAAMLCSSPLFAHDFEVGGIYYNITSNADLTVAVTYKGSSYNSYSNEYSGTVTIPESVTYNEKTYSVTSIGVNAFKDCSRLNSITIPNSVTSIGPDALYGTAWYDKQSDGVVYIGNVLYEYKGTMPENTSIEVKEGTVSISTYAFEERPFLTSIIIPNSVTSIGNYAFSNCSNLTSITIPNSVTSIGNNAFYGTSWYNQQLDGVVYIGNVLYKYKGDMPIKTSIKVKEGTVSISGLAFQDCSGLKSITIPNSVTSIGNMAFDDCTSLTSINIPNSVTSIESGAFTNCSALTSIAIPNSVTSIGHQVFYGCKNLTSVTIPNSVTSIGSQAFYNCKNLTSVTIPNSVTSIEDYAFRNCSSLTSITIPNSVTSIGSCAFEYCSGLTSITTPNSVTSIGNNAFYGTSWYNQQLDGVVYIGNVLYKYKGDMTNKASIEVKEGTVSISPSAFSGCSGLTSITIPNSVKSIGNYAFAVCTGLTSVTIPNSVTSIGNYAFRKCSSLTSITIPNSVTNIGDYAFEYCTGLTSIIIGEGVTSIENYAFSGCTGLTSVTIPNSVKSIGNYAFSVCSSLTSIIIGEGVTSIENYAFFNCKVLAEFISHIPADKLFPVDRSAFDNLPSNSVLTVPAGAKATYEATDGWKRFNNIIEMGATPEIRNIVLQEGVDFVNEEECEAATVTYSRTLPNLMWNALYVPFELPYDVVAEHYDVAYINDVNGYDTDDNGTIDDLAMEIIKIKGGTLKANYPYLIKAKTAADRTMSITVEDATLYAAEENSVRCSSVYQNYAVTGIYTKKTAEELAGKLAISTSGAWQPLAAGTALNPFRLYLSITNIDDSPLKVETSAMSRMRIVEHGETTGVETITPAQQREDVIIDLSGRRVKQPVKGGVYIVNGKKQIF